MLHLKRDFDFDISLMDPPFRPDRFADAARSAEDAGYACLVIDSFSMEWVGLGGVLDWQAAELERMSGGDFRKAERMKMASWIKPKQAHKSMVYSLLQRRIPIIFSIRGEETVKPGESSGDKPTKIFKSVCNSHFPYEVTLSFRLDMERKGIIDLSDQRSFKMEGSHREMFKHGEQISERHGEMLAAWARGEAPKPDADQQEYILHDAMQPAANAAHLLHLAQEGQDAADRGTAVLKAFWSRLTKDQRHALAGNIDAWKLQAREIDELPQEVEQ